MESAKKDAIRNAALEILKALVKENYEETPEDTIVKLFTPEQLAEEAMTYAIALHTELDIKMRNQL